MGPLGIVTKPISQFLVHLETVKLGLLPRASGTLPHACELNTQAVIRLLLHGQRVVQVSMVDET